MKCSVDDCPNSVRARGLCNTHYLRVRRGSPLTGLHSKSDWGEKFLAYMNESAPGECWVWTGPLNGNGYGSMNIAGDAWTMHRLSYALHHGDLPNGAFICHHCDNPPCVNPSHLYAGTPADNVRDRVGRNRTVALRGERAGSSVLRESDVREIRALAERGFAQATIAGRFGVCKAAVSHIVTRRNWGHVA